MSYQGKTYLVTGGAGFIGSHLCRALLDGGAHVINVDEYNDFYDPRLKELNVRPLLEDYPQRFLDYRVDIRNARALSAVFDEWGSQINQVIHLAARAGVRPSLEEPQLYLDTNVTGTMNLLEAMRRHQITRMVFASSSSVYGSRTDPPFREDQDISRPISPYASTKAMCEQMLYTYSHLWDMQVVALRFFTVYGAAQRPDLAIHKFTRLIDDGKAIPVYGDGKSKRDYTYISDILQGIQGAMAYDKTSYEVFNLGESRSVELMELIQLLERLLDKPAKLNWQPMQPGDVPMTCADIGKARALLGYNPLTQIEDGLIHFTNWYKGVASNSSIIS